MEIKVEDYLSEKEIKQILTDAIKDKCSTYLENNFERMASNAAYYVIWKSVDEVIDGSFEEILKGKINKAMTNFNEFNIFQKPDAWSRETNSAYKLLMQSIADNKHLLDDRVKEVIKTLQPKEDWQLDLDVRIGDLIMSKLFSQGE
jgi:adenine-specific DNA methylase